MSVWFHNWGFVCYSNTINYLWYLQKFNYNTPFDIKWLFLDISKAFHKVWLDDLFFKLQSCGTGGNLLNLFQNYLTDSSKEAILNEQTSFWQNIFVSAPEGSVFRSSFFLIHLHDFSDGIVPTCKNFGDNTLFSSLLKDK